METVGPNSGSGPHDWTSAKGLQLWLFLCFFMFFKLKDFIVLLFYMWRNQKMQCNLMYNLNVFTDFGVMNCPVIVQQKMKEMNYKQSIWMFH